MEPITFQQDPGLSPDVFILERDRLRIVRKGIGLETEQVVILKDIDPTFQKTSRLFKRLFVVPLALALAMLIATWKLAHQDTFPTELTIVPLIAFVLFLWHTARGFTPIEIYRVRNKRGEILFELYRPRRSRLRYEEFVSALGERVGEQID